MLILVKSLRLVLVRHCRDGVRCLSWTVWFLGSEIGRKIVDSEDAAGLFKVLIVVFLVVVVAFLAAVLSLSRSGLV